MTEPEHLATTRAAYDATADLYVAAIGTEISAAIEAPLDRALLQAFADGVPSGGRVVDLGCGPGRVAAFLAACGLEAFGLDVSPAMVSLARQAHPAIPFEVGSLEDLPLADASVDGAVCWYSIIHTPAHHLPIVAGELARVLRPGAPVLVAFQAGTGDTVHRSEVQGRAVALTSHRHDPTVVADALTNAGLDVLDHTVRDAQAAHETTPQAFLVAQRPGSHRR